MYYCYTNEYVSIYGGKWKNNQKHGKGTYLIYDNNKLLSRRILNHYENGI